MSRPVRQWLATYLPEMVSQSIISAYQSEAIMQFYTTAYKSKKRWALRSIFGITLVLAVAILAILFVI